MPSVSTSNIIYKHSDLGMGISMRTAYDNDIRQIISEHVLDTTRDNCCKPPTYTATDLDAEAEQKLRDNFPQFSDAIHRLIEERRDYMRVHANSKPCCNIL